MVNLPSSHIKGNRSVQLLVFHDHFLLSNSVQLPFWRFKDPFVHFEKVIESPKGIKLWNYIFIHLHVAFMNKKCYYSTKCFV